MNRTLPSNYPHVFVHVMHSTVVLVPIYGFSFYCVQYKSIKEMSETYRRLLMALVVFAFLFDATVGSLVTPAFLVPAIGGYPAGLFNFFEIPTLFQMFFAMFNFLDTLYLAFYAIGGFMLQIAAMILYTYLVMIDREATLERLSDEYPELEEELWFYRTVTIYGNGDFFTLGAHLVLLAMCAGVSFILFLVFYTFHQLNKQKEQMSAKTLEIKRHFLVSLSLQCAAHVCLLAVPCIVLAVQVIFRYLNRGNCLDSSL